MNFTTGVSNTHTYYGNSTINFIDKDDKGLTVTIDTARLHIQSVEPSEETYQSYAALFGDKKVMNKFATGKTKSREDIEASINNTWVKRWHKKDPYSGLAIFKKGKDECIGEFIGHIALGHGGNPGQAELGYLLMEKHWDQKFATEAVNAVVKEYAPATVKEGYTLDGKTLEKITATARIDNIASVTILKKLGMHKVGEEEKFGGLRYFFSLDLNEIIKA